MFNFNLSRDQVDRKIAAAFQSCLSANAFTEQSLAGAVAHALRHPGSMVRARISYLLSGDFGIEDEVALKLAVSIELFHTASLLLDDLPCMDNAEERRGVPCTHVKFGEAATILSALALINKAYTLLWEAMHAAPAAMQTEATRFVEQCLGMSGILNGQSYDLHFTSHERSASRVMRVAIGKTVSLIKMTLVLPALLGGASAMERKILGKLSVFWGLAYQVMDDLKDVLAATNDAGKTTHRDDLLGRPNLALAEGPIRTSKLLARLIHLGDSALAQAADRSRMFNSLTELRRILLSQVSQLPPAAAQP
jgi:geranylgeranyl diphosphate synthase type II